MRVSRMKEQRVEWIDIFKLFGIVAIYCGHLGRETGGLHDFVFLYHVPLFFFASGIFADHMENLSFWEAVQKKIRQIIVPYLFFVAVSMIMILLTTDENIYTYLGYGKQFIWGIRNQMYASSLWFFSCLFCMSIIFDLLRRIFKKRILLLIVSIAIYFVTVFVLPNRPDAAPSWVFNIDSALYYLIYYTAGYLFHERLTEERKNISNPEKLLCLAGVVFLMGYTLLVYMRKDILADFLYRSIPGVKFVYPVIRALLLILFQIALAKLFVGIGNLHAVGAQTLWMCGNEFVVKKIFAALAETVGIQIEITSALSAVLYACVLIGFVYKVLMPAEKKIYGRILINVSQIGECVIENKKRRKIYEA